MWDNFVNQDEHSSWRMCTAVLRTCDPLCHSQASFSAVNQWTHSSSAGSQALSQLLQVYQILTKCFECPEHWTHHEQAKRDTNPQDNRCGKVWEIWWWHGSHLKWLPDALFYTLLGKFTLLGKLFLNSHLRKVVNCIQQIITPPGNPKKRHQDKSLTGR